MNRSQAITTDKVINRGTGLREPGVQAKGLLTVGNNVFPTLLLFALHIPLALLVKQSPHLATFHAWGIIVLGLFAIYLNNFFAVAVCLGYIAGAEIIWRMVPSATFWEQGKYSMVLLSFLSLFLTRKEPLKRLSLHFYFFLLLPSVLLTVFAIGSKYRGGISFNMSGPLSLYFCGLFFSNREFNLREYRSLLAWTIMPVISVAFLCYYGIVSVEQIVFNYEANDMTSGGYGPNQVATILGTGIALLFLLAIYRQNKLLLRLLFSALILWFLAQAMLTFSRGGVVVAIAAIILVCLYIFSSKAHNKFSILFVLLACSLISLHYVYPRLNEFAEKKLEVRYQETSTTGRTAMMFDDIIIFLNHPLIGVGPGRAKHFRINQLYRGYSAHTETSRMLSEHGILGLFSLFFLFYWLHGNYRQQHASIMKATILMLAILGVGTMLHSAMRMAMISFLLGLTAARVTSDSMDIPLDQNRTRINE